MGAFVLSKKRTNKLILDLTEILGAHERIGNFQTGNSNQ